MTSSSDNFYRFKHNSKSQEKHILLIACGALGKEVIQLIEHNNLRHLDVQCLPAKLHHQPVKIPAALEACIQKYQGHYQHIYVAYGDCGTAGGIDQVLDSYGVERIPGPHCFSFYEGNKSFLENDDNVTSFFLTDFFCKHFDTFMWQQYGLDKRPDMVSMVFGNYRKLVYVAQTQNNELIEKAERIAQRVGLEFELRFRGYSDLGEFVLTLDRI